MMSFRLRYRPGAIHKCQGGLEVREDERFGQVMLGDHLPIR
jgi:hypothetical protein